MKKRFKKHFPKKNAGCPEWILVGIRKINDKAVFKPLAGIESDMPCNGIDPQTEVIHA